MCHPFSGVRGQRIFPIIITVKLFAGPRGILCTRTTFCLRKLRMDRSTILPRTLNVFTYTLQNIIML